jgi:hypothetical protein
MSKYSKLDDLITAIAPLAYPKEDLVTAKKRVRQVVAYAEKTGHLTINRKVTRLNQVANPTADERDFQVWAASKWSAVRVLFKVPISEAVITEVGRVNSFIYEIALPADRKSLERQFLEMSEVLRQTKEQLDKCTKRLAQLEEEAATRKNKDDLTTRRRTEAGRAGGRGKWKDRTRD